MTERVHYSNAPITEATIDLRVSQSQGLSIDDLMVIQQLVADSYPSQENEYLGPRFEESRLHSGFRFTSRDKRQVLYARIDGFAFSVRAPYEHWEAFRDEARRLWGLYRSVTKPESVTRVEVRYINQLDLPASPQDPGVVKTEDYLRVYPHIPDDWPGGDTTTTFFMQLQMWQEDLRCWLVVNEAPVWPNREEPALLQLDFDFFREQLREPWRADDDTEVWRFLEQLHVRKNEVFEASVTDATRRLIK